mgnify:FL=1
MSKNPILKNSKLIINKKGNLKKLLNKKSIFYKSFGELYSTSIKHNMIKGWKLHKSMVSNIFLISGKVKFVFVIANKKNIVFEEFSLDEKRKNHIFIPSNIFYGFKGLSKSTSIMINLSSTLHSDKELINKKLDYFDYKWKK